MRLRMFCGLPCFLFWKLISTVSNYSWTEVSSSWGSWAAQPPAWWCGLAFEGTLKRLQVNFSKFWHSSSHSEIACSDIIGNPYPFITGLLNKVTILFASWSTLAVSILPSTVFSMSMASLRVGEAAGREAEGPGAVHLQIRPSPSRERRRGGVCKKVQRLWLQTWNLWM